MTEQAEGREQMDWLAVERQTRAREPFALLAVAAFFAGWAGISDSFVGLSGTAKWLIVTGYLLVFAGLFTAQRVHPRLRARAADSYRVQYALREHVDPGPGIRDRVDRQAAYMDRLVWFRWWFLLLVPAGILLGARWDRPLITVPVALLLVALAVWSALFVRRSYRAAKRWVADPPGPAREMPPLRRWQRWVSSWWFLLGLLGFMLVTVGLGVLVAVTR